MARTGSTGADVLVKKAAVDQEFRAQLLTERSGAAVAIGLELANHKKNLLDQIPVRQLDEFIDLVAVGLKDTGVFQGNDAGATIRAVENQHSSLMPLLRLDTSRGSRPI